MPDYQKSTDPVTGRQFMADQLTPTVPVVDGSGDGGDLLLQALVDNIEDAKHHVNEIVFTGVADWDGATGTDNGAAFDAVIQEAIDTPGHTKIIFPAGRYYVGSANLVYAITSEITFEGIGDVEIAGDASSSILAFNGELSSLLLHPVLNLDGDHNRTLRVGSDGLNYYDGVTQLTTKLAHEASVGEQIHVLSSERYGSGNGGQCFHISRVIATPTSTTLTMAHRSLWDFTDDTVAWCPRYHGPLHVKNIKWTQFNPTSSASCIRCYRVSNSSVEDCEFVTTNPNGQSDHFLVSDCMNFRFERNKWTEARYAIITNRTRNIYARDNEANYLRHFISPGYGTYLVYVDNLWGHDNTSLIDGHEAIRCTFKNVHDENAYAGAGKNDLFNCRCLGFTLENVYWDGWSDAVGNKNIYLGMNSTFDTKYENLLRRFPIVIKNTTLNTRTASNVSLLRAGTVVFNGFHIGGSSILELGNSTEGVQRASGLDTVSGFTSIRQFQGIQTWEQVQRPQHWIEPVYTEYTGTAVGPGGGANEIEIVDGVIPDNADPVGYLCEITGGTGIGQTLRIIGWDGDADTAVVAADWSPAIDATSIYRISRFDLDAADQRYFGLAYRWNKLYGHLWGGDILNGETDVRTRRVRINLGTVQSFAIGSPRYDVISLTIRLNHSWAGTRPARQEWKYLVYNKPVPTPGFEVIYVGHDGLYHASNDWGLTLSDWKAPGGFEGWLEFNITLGANVAGHSVFIEADASGYS